MNYIGSKHRLRGFIRNAILDRVNNPESLVLCDIFAGTGAVAREFKPVCQQLIVNDLEYYSYVLNRHYVGNSQPLSPQPYLEELNQVEGFDGFIFTTYCAGSGSGRQYFSDENGRRIDSMRLQIEEWHKTEVIDEDLYYYLLTALLEAADSVANTASVYGAFLKHLKSSAQKKLMLTPIEHQLDGGGHRVYNRDANDLIEEISGDILYLDPPYNRRQYGANYHLLNTIAQYQAFSAKGKTGLPDYVRSDYCQSRLVSQAFEALIAAADFRFIFLSYNNEGLMTCEQVEEILSRYGRYSLETTDYQRFKADRDENRAYKADATIEYLHILEKR